MAHWVLRSGALAYLIPSVPLNASLADQNQILGEIISDLDGVILHGGADVAPETYGETAIKPEWAGDAVRDRYEIAIVNKCLELKKPLLGICRGSQVLNVALGGTMYQDINTQVPGSLVHRDGEIYDQLFHDLDILPGTYLETLAKKVSPLRKKFRINTVHHQGIKELGKGLIVEARSPSDGIIEAIRLQDSPCYAMGVQWHPEFQDDNDQTLFPSAILIADFFEAIREKRQAI